MTTRQMPITSAIAMTSVLEAIKMIRAEQAPSTLVGQQAAEFYEIWTAPNAEDLEVALRVAKDLLTTGLGVRVTTHWPFGGTRQWAVRSADVVVVNRGT